MSDLRCPGQDIRRWRQDDVPEVGCPQCGTVIEFFPDDILRKCPQCGRAMSNPKFNMACLEWCQYAAKCMEGMLRARREAIGAAREELRKAVRDHFGTDAVRIRHAEDVLAVAEEIARLEAADPYVVVPAALLHDVGLAGVPVDSDTPAARDHGPAGAEKAREILAGLGFPESVLREVEGLVRRHHDREAATTRNARTLWDADLIVNLRKRPRETALERLRADALTDAGRAAGEREFAP